MQRVAVLGLGIIGSGIARNLLHAGFPLAVYNRSRARAEQLGAMGARVAQTPRDAAGDADVVIAAVANDEASEAVWLGEDGALVAAAPQATLVECSTLSTIWVGRLATAAQARDVAFLDAPVLGSKEAAQAGELRLLVGGDPAVLERVRDVLAAFSAEVHHLGPNGAGAQMKLINNAMVAAQIVALAEGLVIAEQAGLHLDQVVQLLSNGAPGSPAVRGRAARMAAHDYEDVHFALRWMHKDAGYGIAEGARHSVPMPAVAAAREVLQLAISRGLGDLDFGGVIKRYGSRGRGTRGKGARETKDGRPFRSC